MPHYPQPARCILGWGRTEGLLGHLISWSHWVGLIIIMLLNENLLKYIGKKWYWLFLFRGFLCGEAFIFYIPPNLDMYNRHLTLTSWDVQQQLFSLPSVHRRWKPVSPAQGPSESYSMPSHPSYTPSEPPWKINKVRALIAATSPY